MMHRPRHLIQIISSELDEHGGQAFGGADLAPTVQRPSAVIAAAAAHLLGAEREEKRPKDATSKCIASAQYTCQIACSFYWERNYLITLVFACLRASSSSAAGICCSMAPTPDIPQSATS